MVKVNPLVGGGGWWGSYAVPDPPQESIDRLCHHDQDFIESM